MFDREISVIPSIALLTIPVSMAYQVFRWDRYGGHVCRGLRPNGEPRSRPHIRQVVDSSDVAWLNRSADDLPATFIRSWWVGLSMWSTDPAGVGTRRTFGLLPPRYSSGSRMRPV